MTKPTPKRRIGDALVNPIGLGCWAMTDYGGQGQPYGFADMDQARATLDCALEQGLTLIDTAHVYGVFENERLVGKALTGKRDRAYVSTKFGFRFHEGAPVGLDSRPKTVRASCDDSLLRIGIDRIDLFLQHRSDQRTPIEEVMGELENLRAEGKIRHVGLSECAPDTLSRAMAVGKVDAIQSEYSLWEREVEEDIIPLCIEHDISFIAYSPLGRGFLTGTVAAAEALPAGDYRASDPRYQGENYQANLGVVDTLKGVAARHGASPAQIALAWLLAQYPNIIPIPGTRRPERFLENTASEKIVLSETDLQQLVLAASSVSGARYDAFNLSMVRR